MTERQWETARFIMPPGFGVAVGIGVAFWMDGASAWVIVVLGIFALTFGCLLAMWAS